MIKYQMILEDVPSVNALYGRTRQGFQFVTKEHKQLREDMVYLVKAAGIPSFGPDKKVIVEAVAYWPDKRRRDMNNFAKVICDGLQDAGVVPDDKMILWREMDFHHGSKRQAFELWIYEKPE